MGGFKQLETPKEEQYRLCGMIEWFAYVAITHPEKCAVTPATLPDGTLGAVLTVQPGGVDEVLAATFSLRDDDGAVMAKALKVATAAANIRGIEKVKPTALDACQDLVDEVRNDPETPEQRIEQWLDDYADDSWDTEGAHWFVRVFLSDDWILTLCRDWEGPRAYLVRGETVHALDGAARDAAWVLDGWFNGDGGTW